ncbi:MAG: RNA-guided pseudouridylation complex pseudouridine synthase subunit Cbf5 [Candidatus Pacearchaeota archaeon]
MKEKIENIIKEAKKKPIQELLQFSILNIDKPSGLTSFSVDEYIRKKLNIKKTSHFGTLDPKVTGVLPISLGRACRLMEYFIHREKTYVGIMHLHKDIEEKILKDEIIKFIGKIKQLPPKRSRVKRQERIRTIYEFEILEKKDKDVLFKVRCEAGTYIRKLIHDVGLSLKCNAHMTELRRIKASIFSEEDEEFINLYEFDKVIEDYKKGNENLLRKILIPAEIVCKILPFIEIKEYEEILKKLYNGYKVKQEMLKEKFKLKENEIFCLFYSKKFVGIYKTINQKDILAIPEFVYKPL